MLVLSRKKQEIVRIGENIFVQVVDLGKGRVRLGIGAPRDVNIRRDELPISKIAPKRITQTCS